jgi:hypothetical protein
MKHQTTTPLRKLLFFTLPVIISLTLGAGSAAGESAAPDNPLEIKTRLENGWELSITSSAKETTSEVGYHSSSLLNSINASVPINDCSKMANAIDAAVVAIKAGKSIPNERFGDATISIAGSEGHKVVTISTTLPEFAMFSSALEQNLPPEEASKFAKSLRAVPLIYDRLMSSIDFAGIWKTQ